MYYMDLQDSVLGRHKRSGNIAVFYFVRNISSHREIKCQNALKDKNKGIFGLMQKVAFLILGSRYLLLEMKDTVSNWLPLERTHPTPLLGQAITELKK